MRYRQRFIDRKRGTVGPTTGASEGFTLIEVLVALIVISVGLLGIAKLQAVALSSTGTAGKRSIAALEAASLAAAMHADRAYWASTNTVTATIAGSVVTSSDNNLAAFTNCAAVANQPCTATQMAAYDLQTWAGFVQPMLPAYQATITCTQATGLVPATCTIQLVWTENVVAANTQGNQGIAQSAFQQPIYVLYVEP